MPVPTGNRYPPPVRIWKPRSSPTRFKLAQRQMIIHIVPTALAAMPLVEQELLTLPEHLSSPPVFDGVRVTRSLVLYVCFVDRCLSFCTFSFGHCVVCSSSIYGCWLPLWYLQTLLKLYSPPCFLLDNLTKIMKNWKEIKLCVDVHGNSFYLRVIKHSSVSDPRSQWTLD
jgi:hypothetical protein